jgi:hypothetical protein
MAWARRTRISLLITLLLVAASLSWLASHPSLYAGQVGRLLTTNLLHEAGATFSCRDLEGNPLSRMVFRDVTVTREGDDGSFLYLTADSLVVGYDLRDVWGRRTQLQEFIIGGVEILLRQGSRVTAGAEGGRRAGRLPPDLRVDHLGLLAINTRVTRADGETLQEFRDFNLELSAQGGGEGVDVLLTRAEVEWVTQDVRLHHARGRMRFVPPRYEFSSVHVQTDSIRARVDGLVIVDDGLDSLRIEGRAELFHLNELLRAIGREGDGPRLLASGDAVVTKSGEILSFEAKGEGFLEDARVRGEEVSGRIEGDVFRIDHVRGQYRSARGTGAVEVRMGPGPPRVVIDGVVEGADSSDPWADGEDLGWPGSRLAGVAHLELSLGDSIALQLDMRDLRGEAATLPVDSADVRLSWSEARGLVVREARINTMGTLLQVEGTIAPDGAVALSLSALVDSLAPWAREVTLPLAGEQAELSGTLTGDLDSLRLDASGQVAVIRALDLEVEDSLVEFRIPALVTRPGDFELELFAPRLEALGKSVGALGLAMTRVEPFLDIHHLALARADSDLVARGRVEERPEGLFAVEIDTLGMSWSGDQWKLVEGRRMELADGYFQTGGLVFESEVGRIAIEGGVRPPGLLNLTLDVREGDLNILDRLDLLEGIEGGLNGHIEISGLLDSTDFFVDATVDTLVLPGHQIDFARIAARSAGHHMEIDVFEFDSAKGAGSVDGTIDFGEADWLRDAVQGSQEMLRVWRGASLELNLRTRDLDVAHWADPSAEPARFGLVGGDLELSGFTTGPQAEGTLSVRGFPAPPFLFPLIEGQLFVDGEGVRLEHGQIDLGGPRASVRASLPLMVSLTDSVRFLPEKGVSFQIETPRDMDLTGLSTIWPELRRTSGKLSLDYSATGDPRNPQLEGSLQLRDGEVQLVGWSEWLRELEIDGQFSGQQLLLDRIHAREGAKGKIDASGAVTFVGLLPDDIALDFDVERVLISSVPDLKAIASGDDLTLRLERPGPDAPRAPMIAGSLIVDKAVYTGSFESDAGGNAGLGPTVAPPWMARLRIRMQDQVRISNSFTELRVAGDVDLIRDTGGFRVRGEVEIPSGRVSLVGTEFKITQGSLDFSRRPLEPEIDLSALTEVPVYDTVGEAGRTLEEITVDMTGTFAEPELSFQSKSGYDDAAILRMLAGFQPTQSTSSNAVGTLGMRAGFSVLERALAQEMTGVDTLEIDTTESGVDEVGSTRIAFGKYLTESVYLRYAQGLTAGERDILLEYQMSRRTLISGEIKSRINEVGPEDEFNVDFKWRIRY